MKSRKAFFISLIICLCFMLVFIGNAVIFSSHSCDCINVKCNVCTLSEAVRNTFATFALFFAIYLLKKSCFCVGDILFKNAFLKSCTPVGLKVKLSD